MKTCLVGYTPDDGGQEALALARRLAAPGGMELVACIVTPESWGDPTLVGVDQEYARFVDQYAQDALERARAAAQAGLPDAAQPSGSPGPHESPEGAPALRCERVAAASATAGLAQAAERTGAALIVLGSARDGALGRLLLGSVTDELLHVAPVPVAIAPRGYTGAAPLSRVTVAYSGGESGRSTVLHALGLAGTLKLPLRVVSFAVQDRQMFPSLVGYQAEDALVHGWCEQAKKALQTVREQIAVTGYPVETAVGVGASWDDALASIDWQAGELLLLGSSRLGPIERVFLGSNAAKILRASPVPAVVLPRQS